MFAEELTQNASRKRAEDNRAKRRQLILKQQQQQLKKKQQAAEEKERQQQQHSDAASAAPPSTDTGTTVNNGAAATTKAVASPSSAASPVQQQHIDANNINNKKNVSVLDRAKQQRQLRATEAARQKAAVAIQSHYRASRDRVRLRAKIEELLAGRLQDVATLATIIKAKTGAPYIPPPATTTVLTQQLLYLTTTTGIIRSSTTTTDDESTTAAASPIRQRQRCLTIDNPRYRSMLDQLLEYALIPGVESNDEDLNPLVVWVESPAGRARLLDGVVRLLYVALLRRRHHSSGGGSRRRQQQQDPPSDDINNRLVANALTFLRKILQLDPSSSSGDSSSSSASSLLRSNGVVQMCRAQLLGEQQSTTASKTKTKTKNIRNIDTAQPLVDITYPSLSTSMKSSKTDRGGICVEPFAVRGGPLHLISIVRYYLLFNVSGSLSVAKPEPIPTNANELREACIPVANRNIGGQLVQLLVDAAIIEQQKNTTTTSDWARRWQCQLVTHIFTVPLLTWKVSAESVSFLVTDHNQACSDKSNKTVASAEMLACHVPFVKFLRTFLECYGPQLSVEDLSSMLPAHDVPLTICPATNTQCLLANVVQMSLLCPAINGEVAGLIDSTTATIYFDFVARVLDAVPLRTFCYRESAVEWISTKEGKHTPIIISPLILEQCRALLIDSVVRRLFCVAIDVDRLATDKVLGTKNDKDLELEKEMAGEAVSSATALASKEARVERSKKFWNSSRWAKNLGNRVASMFTEPQQAEKSSSDKIGAQPQALMNRSSASRKLAGGEKSTTTSTTSTILTIQGDYSTDLFFALCKAFAVVLARWGGGGKDDILGKKSGSRNNASTRDVATSKPEPFTLSLLNVLCFSTPIVRAAWGLIQSDDAVIVDTYAVIGSEHGNIPVRTQTVNPTTATSRTNNAAVLLYTFVCTLSHTLIITDDVELMDMEKPLPLHQIRRCIKVLKKLLYRASYIDDPVSAVESNYFGLALISSSARTMRDLYDRSSRKPLCTPRHFVVPDLMSKELKRCKTHAEFVALLSTPILRICPYLVSFKSRLRLFERIVVTQRISLQGVNDGNPFNTNPLKPGIPVRISRSRLLEDGLATMNNLGPNMRQRIAVQYVNEAGARESGVDAGGLFKEFWTDMCALAFNPDYALFRVTEANNLYPNPSSGAAHGSDHIMLFEFLGRILGKALYEGITIHPVFAHFFLSFLRGDYNYLHMLPDLSSVDSQLYNNLMFLKTYDGDAEDLCLSFTITTDDFGTTRETPLIPNGANIDVTNANKQRYIGMVAKYYVVDRVRVQSEAFTRGLHEVIDQSWLRLFNEPELQVLISGSSGGAFDIDDWRANSSYAGGYTGIDLAINRFWRVVAAFDAKQQASLLRFVTSCERPPPLGFASLNPPFTIQRVGGLRDGGALPTASTCFNVLKLYPYGSDKIMRQRLLYAIESGAGFELT